MDMKRGVGKMHLLKKMVIIGMASASNGQVLVGAGEWKVSRNVSAYYLVDLRSGVTRKVADAESAIWSI